MTPPRQFPSWRAPLPVLSNWPLWLGLMLYGTAFLFYATAAARLPLNVAHPVLTAGAIATVALLSVTVFREPIHWPTLVGMIFITSQVH